jgi:RNA polymerase sigma-70 factor (ECF subfamily)
MVGRHGYTEQDREDIEQDLACDLLRRLRRFDPAKGSRNAFIARRVEAAASNLIRARKVGKRSAVFERDVFGEDVDEGGAPRIELMIDAAQAETARLDELRDDVATAIAVLPANLRSIAVGLQNDTHRVVARRHGISRRQLYHGIAAIRNVFTRCGLAPA